MIIFQHNDKKFLCLKHELNKIGIEAIAVVGHPIFAPFFILKQIISGRKVKVYVFRYINDSESFILAIIRWLSELSKIAICKIFGIKIWWLCHNVDKETTSFHPKITNLRRKNIVKYAKRIFTTNKMLIPVAQQYFPNKFIDSLSLGYIEGSISNKIKADDKTDNNIVRWIENKANKNSKIIFCVGSPAAKSLHFRLISDFITEINKHDVSEWYAVVVGDKVEESPFIYNIPYKHFINPDIIKRYANYYYRVIDDYSISYSLFEAVHYRIPIITEPYGILPDVVRYYNIGIVVEAFDNTVFQVEHVPSFLDGFELFERENNWVVATHKIKYYYQKDVR